MDDYRSTLEHDGGGPLSEPWVARIYRPNASRAFLRQFFFTRWGAERWLRRKLRQIERDGDKWQEQEVKP